MTDELRNEARKRRQEMLSASARFLEQRRIDEEPARLANIAAMIAEKKRKKQQKIEAEREEALAKAREANATRLKVDTGLEVIYTSLQALRLASGKKRSHFSHFGLQHATIKNVEDRASGVSLKTLLKYLSALGAGHLIKDFLEAIIAHTSEVTEEDGSSLDLALGTLSDSFEYTENGVEYGRIPEEDDDMSFLD